MGAPIRCNYSGSTANQAFTGVGINPVTNTQTGTYEAWMNVLPGQTYMLLVNNFSATNNGFTLNFTGGIFTANPNALDCSTACALSIGTDVDVCPGTTTILAANISNATSYVWSSTAAGFVNPGNVQSITVSVPGTYTVVVNKPGCNPNATASATVTIPAAPATGTPNNLTQCITNPLFNLNVNTPVVLNGLSGYTISYHNTLLAAQDGTGGTTIPNTTNYPGTNGETIFVSIEDDNTSCVTTTSFQLFLTTAPTPPNPADVTACNSYTLPALASNETYHTASGGSPLTQIAAGTVINTSQTIYVFSQSALAGCTSEGDFVVTIITGTPPNPSDVTVCGSYTLPALPAGSTYHSASGGATATLLPVGTVLTTSQVVYVVSQSSGTPSCSSEGDFALTVNTAPVTPNPADVTACDSYVLPVLPAGQSYHSAAGGSPATQIPAGTIITTNQTIYIFAQSGTVPNCTAEGDFTITINLTPATPNPADVTVCNSYILPALPAGSSYHTLPNGGGTTLLAGATITTTQVIYVFAQTGTTPNCTSEGDFLVTVNNTPVP
ncbi:MAG TPA: hypothetical protein DIU01_01405, partial [Flavobacterium sp.]|nr:hypothetical protein [Flavobacterium sp.]